MRPVRLQLEGFAAFRDMTEIDFTGLDLVALVGPTGSGKSTVIDAITFALYGSVARYGNALLVAPVIHQLSVEAKVRFDFELGGATYVAVRVVRRVKSRPGAALRATTKEARLERLGPDGTSTVIAGNVKELDREIEDLLGLNFTQFTRTIVLPQGEFAEFLKDEPSDRQKLLRRLLDLDIYARMGSRARELATESSRWVAMREEELIRLADASAGRLSEANQARDRLAAFASTLEPRLAELASIDDDLATLRQQVGSLDQALGALAGVAVPDDLRTVDEVVSAARDGLDQAQVALDAAHQERVQAVKAVDQAHDPTTLKAQVLHHQRLGELNDAAGVLQGELDSVQAEHREAEAIEAEAATRVEHTTEVRRAARTSADASAWIARLEVGAPCPICDQEVHQVPAQLDAAKLVAIEAAAEEAARVSAAATATSARLAGRVASLEADRAQRIKQSEELAAKLVDQVDPTTLPELLTTAEEAARRADTASTALRKSETTEANARAGLRESEQAEQRFRATFVAQRDDLVPLGPPSPGERSLLDEWGNLATWAGARTQEVQSERAEVAADGKRLAATKSTLIESLADEARALNLTPEPARLAASAAAADATLAAEIDRLGEQLDRKATLVAEIEAKTEQQVVFDALGRQHLSAAGFERWLLAEALDELVERATARLMELSSGRYSLEAVDGSFAVRDHGNADERRDIRTLSGGEIFLASLSLALALAESIAELTTVDGPRLESIFLDEGFGTLDAETLDILAAAIEELSASGRLVCVVTHVRDLAERMPVRFEVRKGSATSTIDRVED
ncbi:MAG: SMC family ATPase [Actinomycetia bacterium]|nr:SMC family ATPase [Actinomycetes bacterium]